MTKNALPVFDDTVHTTHIWLKEIMAELHTDSRRDAYRALRLVLHSVRDHISVQQSSNLAAQLPLLLRGVYYEGWNPSHVPNRDRTLEAFLSTLKEADFSGVGFSPADIARRVLLVLETKISPGEIDDVKDNLPKQIRQLWRPLMNS